MRALRAETPPIVLRGLVGRVWALPSSAVMSKVHPLRTDIQDEYDEESCSPACQTCLVRFVACTLAWLCLFVLAVLVSLPHMIRTFDVLTEDERLQMSCWLGLGWLGITCFLCCACCCLVCCSSDDDNTSTARMPLRRASSLGIDTGTEWAARRFDQLHARQLATATRRLSSSLIVAEQSLVHSASSLRSSTMQASTSMRVSAMRASTVRAPQPRAPGRVVRG